MIELMLVWAALAAWCIALVWRRGPGTLLLAYFFGLSLIHVPGAINHLGVIDPAGGSETRLGFAVTLLGVAAMLAGVSGYRLVKGSAPAAIITRKRGQPRTPEDTAFGRSGQRMTIIGLLVYFLVVPIAVIIPSFTAIVSAMGSLLIVGYWALLKSAAEDGNRRRLRLLVLSLPLLPLLTLISGGFAGYGIYFMLAVLSLYFQITRLRRVILLVAPVAGWLGLSLGVAYLDGRSEIREVVWYQQSGLGDRLERVFDIFENFELYSWNDRNHVRNIDMRLNQNLIVGMAVDRVESGQVALAYGGTAPLWSLVPRVLWPDKPPVGGGRDVVSRYTGLYFASGTSVGAGQPFEFFVNFGWAGLVAGFIFWGILLAHLDHGLARGLRQSDPKRLLYYGMPGMALLQPGGNLMEILISFIAATIAARLAFWGLRKLGLVRRPASTARRIDPARFRAHSPS